MSVAESGEAECSAATCAQEDRFSPDDEQLLHRWLWLRLASGVAAVRSQLALEDPVRASVIAQGLMTEALVAALPWHQLLHELATRAAQEAPLARDALGLLRTRLASSPIADLLGPTELDILVLGTAVSRDRKLQELGTLFTLDGMDDVSSLIADALALPEEQVSAALHPAAPLRFWGLLRCRPLVSGLGDAIEPAAGIRLHLYYGRRPVDAGILRRFCKPLEVTSERAADLSHLAVARQVVQAFLKSSTSARVLLHGKPGVGTSEFIRQTVRALDWQGYVVDLRFLPEERLFNERDFGAEPALAVLRGRPGSVIVFDHATHILRSSARGLRNYIDLIEVPSIWVAENLDLIDTDVLERFDHTLEILPPPTAARLAILREALDGLGVSEACLAEVAATKNFVPATAVRLAHAVPVLVKEGMAADAALKALRSSAPKLETREPKPRRWMGLPYRSEWIRASADLERLIVGLTRVGAGTLLFSGPPGTGKTEFAWHLASRLGRKLLIRSASDLNNALIGETEKAMTRAFEEAERDGSILLIDEVDSFMRSRESAIRTWEVSQVNEMLTQLDRFAGIAIFTTNVPEILDSAVMRRIDRKIEFDYLAPEHRWEVFSAAAGALAVPIVEPDTELRRRVEALSDLTLGDVAVVIRSERLEPQISGAVDLYGALKAEERRRCNGKRGIGFLAESAG